MWLDRFSGNNTPSNSLPPPSPQIRSYSPAPRRPSHLTPGTSRRPSYSPRASSPKLGAGNASKISSNSTRIPNGSTLKQQIIPSDLIDPLEILAEVIGKPLPKKQSQSDNGTGQVFGEFQKPTQLVEDVEFKGLSLHEFASAFDGSEDEKLAKPINPAQTVEECEYVCTGDEMIYGGLIMASDEKEKDKFEDLHRSILVTITGKSC